MYNSDVCYFPNCWAEMGRKLWEDRHFFLCNVVLKWISLGKVCEFFVLKWASLNRSCATILHLIFLTSLKQAVLRARRIMKSNCLRFVTTSCSHLLFPLPRHTLCPSCSVVYSFSIWPSRQRILCLTVWAATSSKAWAVSVCPALELLTCVKVLITGCFLDLCQI